MTILVNIALCCGATIQISELFVAAYTFVSSQLIVKNALFYPYDHP